MKPSFCSLILVILLNAWVSVTLAQNSPTLDADSDVQGFRVICGEKTCPSNVGAVFAIGGNGNWFQCTGALTQSDEVMTNSHCFTDPHLRFNGANALGRVFFKLSSGKQFRVSLIEEISEIDKRGVYTPDYAKLKLQTPSGVTPVRIGFGGFADGAKVDVWKITEKDPSTYVLAESHSEVAQNTIIPPLFTDNQNSMVILKGGDLTHGNSGSPVFNSQGEDIGILSDMNDLEKMGFLFPGGPHQKFHRAQNLACILAPVKPSACGDHLTEKEFNDRINSLTREIPPIPSQTIDALENQERLWLSQNSKIFKWQIKQTEVAANPGGFIRSAFYPDGACVNNSANWVKEYRILPGLYPKTSLSSGSLYVWILGVGPTEDFKGFQPVAMSRYLGHFEAHFDMANLISTGKDTFTVDMFDSAGVRTNTVKNEIQFCTANK